MIQTIHPTEVRIMPLLAGGSIDRDTKATTWAVESMIINWGRQHKDPATRRRVRPVGERPTDNFVLRDRLGDLSFEIDLASVSTELVALLGIYTEVDHSIKAVAMSSEALESVLRREPWLIRLGQRLCGAR